jgi:hypothetical protein
MSLPAQSPPAGTTRIPGSLAPALALVVLLVLAAAGGAWLLLKPHLVFTNRLAAPVRIVVGDAPARTVPPRDSVRLSLARGQTVVLQWELVRPLSADGRPMGEEMRGSAVLRSGSGTMRAVAASRTPDAAFFAPLVTNATAEPLRVTANAGLQGAVDCGCAVRPGGRRVFVGYYRLYQNSTVEGRVAPGRRAAFRDLGPEVTAADGTIGLRFEEKDFRSR